MEQAAWEKAVSRRVAESQRGQYLKKTTKMQMLGMRV